MTESDFNPSASIMYLANTNFTIVFFKKDVEG